jgi:hypothetical protein
MDRFIRHQNIKRYRALLREAKAGADRQLIQKLLREEEQKQFMPRVPVRSTLSAFAIRMAEEVID